MTFKKQILIFIVLFFSTQFSTFASKDTLVVGYYASAPFVIEENNQVSGISIWLWQRIADEIDQPYVLKKMSLQEVIDGIAAHEIDMTINPLSITSERSKIIDFSAPYYISNSSIMVKSVSSFEKGLQFIVSFFSLNFIKAIGALFFVVFIFGFLAWAFEHKKNPDEFNPGIKGLWNGIWWSAVTMTTVGYGDKSPKSLGGRIVGLIWMFAAIIIISGFTASIASSLTVNQLSWNQNKVEDFKEKKLAVIDQSATKTFLEQRFFKGLQPHANLNKCLQALIHGNVEGLAHDEPQLTYISQLDSLNRFEVLPVNYNSQLYAFGFSRLVDSKLKKQITIELLKTTESTDWKVLLSEYGLLTD